MIQITELVPVTIVPAAACNCPLISAQILCNLELRKVADGDVPRTETHALLSICRALATPNLTAFGRFGWDNGKTESFAYTEVDQTFEGGLGANGAIWHRTHDRAGVALVSNAIAKAHQIYLAEGGLGFLLGDGRLNYGRENIVETYYTAHVWRGVYVASDLQHINNPGYNRDRGPVLVSSFRLHVEF